MTQGREYIEKQLNHKMASGRYSKGLVLELVDRVQNRSENIFQILDEIGALEGAFTRPTRTKPAKLFRGNQLKGLWHKHYMQARFIAANVKNHWPTEKLLELVASHQDEVGYGTKEAIGKLVHDVILGGYWERSQSGTLTGEWIIFAKQDGRATYLTLAKHSEDDLAIWQRCKACSGEFPDLEVLRDKEISSTPGPRSL